MARRSGEPRPARTRKGSERFTEAADVLRALSHPARLRIVELLSRDELCVKRLEEILGIPQPSVSQHLSRLRYSGIIESERRGHLVCYRLIDGKARSIARAALSRGEGERTDARSDTKGEL